MINPTYYISYFFYYQSATDQGKLVKKIQQQLKELSNRLEEEQHQREEQYLLATKAEKRANDLTLELEELRTNLEQVTN